MKPFDRRIGRYKKRGLKRLLRLSASLQKGETVEIPAELRQQMSACGIWVPEVLTFNRSKRINHA